MRKSRFTIPQKLEILREKEFLGISTEELCGNHKISITTYYNWKNQLLGEKMQLDPIGNNDGASDLRTENNTLRHLYMDLSEHNYQLSKFLKTT